MISPRSTCTPACSPGTMRSMFSRKTTRTWSAKVVNVSEGLTPFDPTEWPSSLPSATTVYDIRRNPDSLGHVAHNHAQQTSRKLRPQRLFDRLPHMYRLADHEVYAFPQEAVTSSDRIWQFVIHLRQDAFPDGINERGWGLAVVLAHGRRRGQKECHILPRLGLSLGIS